MPIETRTSEEFKPSGSSGPYLAKIISHLDPKYMGTLQVEILRTSGNFTASEPNIVQAKYLSPFYGVTSVAYNDQNNDYNGTQKSYGMWMIPPDVGSLVMVIFVEGDARRCYWIGCVQDEYMNFMVPGLAATELSVEGGPKSPVAEYNKKVYDGSITDPTKVKKPQHPLTDVLKKQGLLEDEIRGITTSSARREVPSAVFGISTPGPVDRRSGAKKGKIGKKETLVSDAFVSRLGGTTFVMDDGDDKFLRKKKASEGGPEYVSVENDEKGGQPDIPHNELVRIRTRTGHQILLHNSEDLIYIAHASGKSWIEMTANGKIDIYAEDSISIHSKNDLNFTADRDINITAGRHVNTNAGGHIWETSGSTNETKAGGNIVETAPNIHMNGPQASTAPKTTRVPQQEPWLGHENLNPLAHIPAQTEAGKTATPGVLTKILDTFKKIGK